LGLGTCHLSQEQVPARTRSLRRLTGRGTFYFGLTEGGTAGGSKLTFKAGSLLRGHSKVTTLPKVLELTATPFIFLREAPLGGYSPADPLSKPESRGGEPQGGDCSNGHWSLS
jgi:hypothetical protein